MSNKPARLIEPPEGYGGWLAELKDRIHAARQRASLAVNRELVLLYWRFGGTFWPGRLRKAGVPRSLSGWRRTCERRFQR